MTIADRALMQAHAGERLTALLNSYQRLTGVVLADSLDALWESEHAVVAHDVKDPPHFFYGNHAALTLFGIKARKFIRMASYKSALPDAREDRAAMLARLDDADIVTGYSGVRVAADQSRFQINNAVIWNLTDAAGKRVGQAAMFGDWTPIKD